MANDNVIALESPAVQDILTDLLRSGARRLIEAAVSAELEECLSGFKGERLSDGRRRPRQVGKREAPAGSFQQHGSHAPMLADVRRRAPRLYRPAHFSAGSCVAHIRRLPEPLRVSGASVPRQPGRTDR